MKNTIACFLLALCVLGIAGCSSTKVDIDSGPITASSFSFVKPKPKPYPVFADPEQKVHEVLQAAITESMAKRNIRRLEGQGDVLVAYMLVTGNNASIASIEDYFGYGRDASQLRNTAQNKYAKELGNINAGTLLIDIVDGSGRVLKRGYASRPLLAHPSPEQRAARAKEVVEEIMSGIKFNP